MSIPNPRPLERDGQSFNETVEEVEPLFIEPWIDAYKVYEDHPKDLLHMTWHHFAKRYEERRGPPTWLSTFDAPKGTLIFPVTDQARRMQDKDGRWGPYPEEETT